jgi:fructuronate reductase
MAYIGGLGGLEFVHQFAADHGLARFVERLWDEAAQTLPADAPLDTRAYRTQLMARFRNPALQHRLKQIAMDGSQKLPPRILPSIAVRLQRGLPSPGLALAVAAWMRSQTGKDEAGRSIPVEDPLAARTGLEAAQAGGPEDLARRLLAIREIFPPALADNPAFQAEVLGQLEALHSFGALQAARRLSGG